MSLLLVYLNSATSWVRCVVKWVGSNRKTIVLTPWLANWREQLTATAPWRCEPQRATTVGHWCTLCGFSLHTKKFTIKQTLYNFRKSFFHFSQKLELKFCRTNWALCNFQSPNIVGNMTQPIKNYFRISQIAQSIHSLHKIPKLLGSLGNMLHLKCCLQITWKHVALEMLFASWVT